MEQLPNIRLITISGRIGAGSTTLAHNLAKTLSWKHIEGGQIFWEAVRTKMGLDAKDTNLRPDEEDLLFDEQLKKMLKEEKNLVLETKLAGFFAQGISDVFKILVECTNQYDVDQKEIRIDRLVNREDLSVDDAKKEVLEREKNDLEKWRKLYAQNDPNWTYFDKKYYDLIINTFSHDKDESLKITLEAIEHKL